MTRKRPPSRDQKALVISDANLSTVEVQENLLLEKICDLARHAANNLDPLVDGFPEEIHRDARDFRIDSCERHLADANRRMRQLRKLQKELD